MRWHEIVFSEQANRRFQRHGIFWLAWWIYFTASYYYFHQPDLNNPGVWTKIPVIASSTVPVMLIKSFILLLTHMIMCYGVIYFVLPRFLLKRRWVLFTAGLFSLAGITLALGYFDYAILFPSINTLFDLNSINEPVFWASMDAGILSAGKVVMVAVGIKLAKHWLAKQKEKEELEKEKMSTELKLLKAQVHPGFLFSALSNIYELALSNSPKTPSVLLKLSDLLSYMLYECDQQHVPLKKEVEMMRDYIELEKTRFDERIETEIQIKGEEEPKRIAPFLLLPFIANSFKQSSNQLLERPWINLDLRIGTHELVMKLINGKPADLHDDPTESDVDIENAVKRLKILYPNRHELKISTEGEMLLVLLRIQLDELVVPAEQKELSPLQRISA